MAEEAFKTIRSKPIHVPQENVDTDQIIPARFLTTTTRQGLGKCLFYDWRYDEEGRPIKDSIFNQEKAKKSKILVTGDNFGCGSSREHAPWAIHDFGFRVVLSTGFADIFKNNAPKSDILPIEIDEDYHQFLRARPDLEITVDLVNCEIRAGNVAPFNFKVDAFVRTQLLGGRDDLDFLLDCESDILRYEEKGA